MKTSFLRPESLKYLFFDRNSGHQDSNDDPGGDSEWCCVCDKDQIMNNEDAREMQVHYGSIATGNQVIDLAHFRDRICHELGNRVLCFDNNAAGVELACSVRGVSFVVIRGISDYADTPPNEAWVGHAAVVAAACAKEFLVEYVGVLGVSGV